jgi:two-component system, NtrC family, nitrogen regulation response regulator GlnG
VTAPVVILADDDEAIRAVLTQAFSRAGYMVRATSNAATLWRWVAEGQGDLVVSDVVLPDENVFEILPRMKKARPGLPIIVMSAKNTIMTAITAAERGAYDYLPKPFDLNELLGWRPRRWSKASARRPPWRPAAPPNRCRSSAARRPCRTSFASSRG